MSLATEKKIYRNSWTEIPITEDIVNQIEKMAESPEEDIIFYDDILFCISGVYVILNTTQKNKKGDG